MDSMLFQDFVDLYHVCLDELPRRQASVDGAPHPIRVGPRPIGLLPIGPMRERDLIYDELRIAAVREWQDGDLLRGGLFIVGRQVGLEAAGIELDHVIEPGLAPVGFETLLIAEECAVVVVRLRRSASAKRDGTNDDRRSECRYQAPGGESLRGRGGRSVYWSHLPASCVHG